MPKCMSRVRSIRIARLSFFVISVIALLYVYVIHSWSYDWEVPKRLLQAGKTGLAEIQHSLTGSADLNAVKEANPKVEDWSVSCTKWESELTSKVSSTPLIRLDPTRLLYPANLNGPSNQLIALQEAIFAGIVTNRTVVIPNFTPHFTDTEDGFGGIVPAFMRVDINHLSRLVSMTTVEDMRQRCDGSFDIGFQPRPATCVYDQYLRSMTNMTYNNAFQSVEGKIVYEGKHAHCQPISLGVRKTPFRMHPDEVKTILRSELPCAVMINNFKNLRRKKLKIDRSLIDRAISDPSSIMSLDLPHTSSGTLLHLIEAFTRRPRYVREIAQQFVRYAMGTENYVTLHWRYNEEWESTFCRSGLNMVKFCDRTHSVKPPHLAGAFILLSKNILNSTVSRHNQFFSSGCDSLHIVNAYMASTTDNAKYVKLYAGSDSFREQFVARMYEKEEGGERNQIFFNPMCWRLQLFHKIDLLKFFAIKYPKGGCSTIWTNLHELVALTENELCHDSTAFAYSEKSSWSLVAKQKRKEQGSFQIWDLIDKSETILR